MFKEKLKEALLSLRETFLDMKLTMCVIMLATVLSALFYKQLFSESLADTDLGSYVLYLVIFLLLTASGTFFSESAFKKNGLKFLFSALFCGLSVFFTVLIRWNPFSWSDKFRSTYMLSWILGYVIITLFSGVYCCYRDTGLSFDSYLLGAFMNLFRVSVVSGILSAGFTLITVSIYLLFEGGEDLIIRSELLIFGLITLPGLIYAMKKAKNEEGGFVRVLVSYIACPIIVLAALVIYVYLGMILVKWEIPSNCLFAILSVLYLLSVPVLTMTEKANDSELFKKAVRVLYFLFIPFILMQIYCLGIRIYDYGITPERFLGIVMILLEAFYLALSLFGKEKRGLILPIAAVLAFFTCVFPFTNIMSVSYKSQGLILKHFEAFPDKVSAEKAEGAYEYLSEAAPEVKNYLTKKSGDEKSALLQLIEEKEEEPGIYELVTDDYYFIDIFFSQDTMVSIDGYDKFAPFGCNKYYYENSNIPEGSEIQADWKAFEIDSDNVVLEDVKVDISGFMEAFFAWYHENGDTFTAGEYPEKFRYYTVDEHTMLYIDSLYISGEKEEGLLKTDNIYISGYYLTR